MASQLQQFCDDADCLDPFQSGFWSTDGMETALVEDLRRDLNRWNAPLGSLSQLCSRPLGTVSFWITCLIWVRVELCYRGSAFSFQADLGDCGSWPVKYDGSWPVKYDGPQTLMLFNTYMKPLGEVSRSLGRITINKQMTVDHNYHAWIMQRACCKYVPAYL